jgi:hypothetical protein
VESGSAARGESGLAARVARMPERMGQVFTIASSSS